MIGMVVLSSINVGLSELLVRFNDKNQAHALDRFLSLDHRFVLLIFSFGAVFYVLFDKIFSFGVMFYVLFDKSNNHVSFSLALGYARQLCP